MTSFRFLQCTDNSSRDPSMSSGFYLKKHYPSNSMILVALISFSFTIYFILFYCFCWSAHCIYDNCCELRCCHRSMNIDEFEYWPTNSIVTKVWFNNLLVLNAMLHDFWWNFYWTFVCYHIKNWNKKIWCHFKLWGGMEYIMVLWNELLHQFHKWMNNS